jgi:hypothetical protein
MAEQLGFYVIQTHHQYVRPYLAETDQGRRWLAEVNDELAYDLVPHGEAVDQMVRHFRTPLQNVAARTAGRWALTASAGLGPFVLLREEGLTYAQRAAEMDELADLAEVALGEEMRWRATG